MDTAVKMLPLREGGREAASPDTLRYRGLYRSPLLSRGRGQLPGLCNKPRVDPTDLCVRPPADPQPGTPGGPAPAAGWAQRAGKESFSKSPANSG